MLHGTGSTSRRSIPLCDVLEAEYTTITGNPVCPPPEWNFLPEQILDPAALKRRLIRGRDQAAAGLRDRELAQLVAALNALGDAKPAALQDAIANGLNGIRADPELYTRVPGRFAGVRFRSQTLDRLEVGPVEQRNRLILEDTFPEIEKLYDIRLKEIYGCIRKDQPAALCLSGGGIRSATFALGVVQKLARHGLLEKFKYLSTVSGGGYLGAWLSAWIYHTSMSDVNEELRQDPLRPLAPEPSPIWHLRTYSNYLSPRLGLLSADTWTLGAIYLRNLLLTWLVFIPPIMGLLAVPLLLAGVMDRSPDLPKPIPAALSIVLAAVAFIGGVMAVRYIHTHRPVPAEGTDEAILDTKLDQISFLRWCLLPLVVATVAATVWFAWNASQQGNPSVVLPLIDSSAIAFGVVGASVHLFGWVLSPHPGQGARWTVNLRTVGEAIVVAISGALLAWFAWWVGGTAAQQFDLQPFIANQPRDIAKIYTWLAVPFVLSVLTLGSYLYVGFASRIQVDPGREWAARFNAWMLIGIVTWLLLFGLVLFGPKLVEMLFEQLNPASLEPERLGQIVVGTIGAISGGITALTGFWDRTPQEEAKDPRRGIILAIAAPVFLVSLVVLLAWLVEFLFAQARELAARPEIAFGHPALVPLAVTSLLVALGLVSGRFVDINKFSLHAMYRARLIRAYLGASRPAGERDPNRFTGFDDEDNLPMGNLGPLPCNTGTELGRPLHVVNVAMNLVSGSNLAWQQRKAGSFTFTPLHCGSHNQGYRPTGTARKLEEPVPGYGGPRGGVTLGTAITISGAAASPNMGYHSSPLIAFLLTLFNVRLGWWLGNPGHAGRDVYIHSAPKSSLALLVQEALGRTDETRPYVYLSDGGHFENLGLYEMVLRRCHTIVVCDASADPDCTFENLGNAIRKIRVDLGIPIDLDTNAIRSRNCEPALRKAGKYCAIGTIRYSCVDKGVDGVKVNDGKLIYLKPAFYEREPMDIYNYGMANKLFPHESTADQFFSESQFESYRALGSHILKEIIESPYPPTEKPVQLSMAEFVDRVETYLGPPAPPEDGRRDGQRPGLDQAVLSEIPVESVY